MKTVFGTLVIGLLVSAVLIFAGCGGDASTGDSSGDDGGSSSDAVGSAGDKATVFAVVDTGQVACYDDSGELATCPVEGEAFYGQDNQYVGNPCDYSDNADGTVTDNVTGLMWQQSPDTDGDGVIDAADKLTYDEAVARAGTLNLGGYSDWRLPTIKELYSLINFSG